MSRHVIRQPTPDYEAAREAAQEALALDPESVKASHDMIHYHNIT